MKRKIFHLLLLAGVVSCLLLACNNTEEEIIPSPEFAPYVSGYTGGVISSQSSIFIELAQEQEVVSLHEPISEKLFSFSPNIKGEARWIDNKTIEFVPNAGALKPGKYYKASFALGKVMEVDKHLQKFEFSFRVQERNFAGKVLSLDVFETDIDKVSIKGEIRFSDIAKDADITKMIKAQRGKDKFTPKIISTPDPLIYKFEIADIPKEKEESMLTITYLGNAIEINKTEEEEVKIPAASLFKLLSSELLEEPEHGVCLTFSDPVSTDQDIQGLIYVEQIEHFTYQIQNNKVTLYFERKHSLASLNVHVDSGLKNSSGKSMEKNFSVNLKLSSPNPDVKLLSSGTILPSAENLILSFSAVNLYAVEVKVIRIFESNILMFLQENQLSSSSSNGLRRSGRLVYKQLLRLDSDPTKNIHAWESYHVDLSKIFLQEPGAMYRVVISFKQEYSAYPCDGNTQFQSSRESGLLTKIDAGNLTEEDEAFWDNPNSYYYDESNYDWRLWEWEQRDNPCHPTYYMHHDCKVSANLLASNIGIIAKRNSDNELWISVSDILTTKPIVNADVIAYNYQLQPLGQGKTDADGFAFFKAKGKPFVVKVISGNEKGYLRLVDGEDNMISRFDVGGKEIKKGLKGFIYGERGVWRPGDTIFLSFMLEQRGNKLPEQHPVTVEIFNPQGQFYTKYVSTSGVNGLYCFAIPTRSDDPTGLWNAYVKVGGATFHKSLRVETIKPNRLKINLTVPGKMIESSQRNKKIDIHAAWLTGATAGGLKTKVEMTLSKRKTTFKGFEKYIFQNPASEFSSSTIELHEGTLDEQGKTSFNMNIPQAKNAPGMLNASLLCHVYEKGGDFSISQQSIPFSPFKTYIGINFNQKDREPFETDKDNIFDVVAVNPDGTLAGKVDLEYKIYRIGWSWWWEHEDESFSSYLNNQSKQPVASGNIKTNGGKARISFKINYPDWGRYLVYVVDRNGGHATGGTIFVDWPQWRGRSQKDDPSGLKMLAFSTDKERYEVGEEVTVMIPAAAGGRALVAIENGSTVLKRDWIDVPASGDVKYTFKTEESMTPNVCIHVSMLQPHSQTVNDLPIRMYGIVPIFIENKNSHLQPQITMPNVLRPEQKFTVKVKESQGKPMTYTLAIVDEGILDLTNFKTPDPWNEFYSREALGIRTWDLYDYVIGAFGGKYGSLFSIGGDEDRINGKPQANRFKPVVRFIGPFELKKGAEKSHTINMPSYVGSVRVMVVAGQDGAYGNAEKTVPVKTPLMLLSTLPRVMSIGERISLPVNIFAMEEEVKNVTVKVESLSKNIVVENTSSKTVSFKNPGNTITDFSLRGASQGIGKVRVTATSADGKHNYKEEIEIDIRNPNPPMVHIENRILQAGEEQQISYSLEDGSEVYWVKMEVSRIPTVDISRRFDFLYDYNHFCTEQLTSRALPLLFVPNFKEMDNLETEQTKKNINEAISHLYGRQLTDGSFMYWPGDGYTNDWVTSYAGMFLVLAKERGYQVSDLVLNKWKNYQQSASQSWRKDSRSNRYSYNQSDLLQSFRLYTLALAGSPDMGSMNRLKGITDLSLQAKWRLAAAYALAGKKSAAEELIFNASTDIASYSSSNTSYGSSQRDEAMILETLILMGRNEEAFKQAQKVSRSLSNEQYFSTQSTAYALVAMGRLAEKMSGSLDFDWKQNNGQTTSVKSSKAIYQQNLSVKQSNGNVTIKNNGKGSLFVSLISKTKPIEDQSPAQQSNIRLDVTYTDMNGKPIDVSNLKQGTDFLAVVSITNTNTYEDYTDLALTHIVPAGWEIFNERLFQGNEQNGAYNYKDIRDDRLLTYFDLKRGTKKVFPVRLSAAYKGRFTLPAISCEAMYNTEVRARTKAAKVEVRE